MGLRQKISLIILIPSFIVVATVLYVVNIFTQNHFYKIQDRNDQEKVASIRFVLEDNSNSLMTLVKDWANWDDTYQFVENKNQQYIKKNYGVTFISNNIDFALLIANNGNLLLNKQWDFTTGKEMGPCSECVAQMKPAVKSLFPNDNVKSISGHFINKSGDVYSYVASKTTDSFQKKFSNGYLIFGRKLTGKKLAFFQEKLHFKIDYELKDSSAASSSEIKYTNVNYKINDSSKALGVSFYTSDGKNLITITNKDTSSIELEGRRFTEFIITSFLVFVLVLLCLIFFFIHYFVLKRLNALAEEMATIETTDNLSLRISTTSNDEISSLGKHVNMMLSRLEQDQIAIRKSIRDSARIESAASIAHDINNPLQIMSLAIEKIKNTIKLGDLNSIDKNLELLEKSANRIALKVKELLTLTKK